MKRHATLLLTIFCTPIFADLKPITFALSENYPPWSWGSAREAQGLSVDLVRAVIEKKMKRPVAFYGLPWVRAQKETFRGNYDGLCAVASQERLQYLLSSKKPLHTSPIHLYTPNVAEAVKGVQGIRDLASLQSAALHFNVYIGAGWARDHLPAEKIEYSSSMESTVKKLATSRGDAVVDNALVILYFMQKLNVESVIYEHPPVIDEMQFFLLINKNSPFASELSKFDTLYGEFMKTSEYKQIVERYDAHVSKP